MQTGAWDAVLQAFRVVGVGSTASVNSVTFTERNGVMTVGGTSQQLADVNPNRKYLFIQNPAYGEGVTSENLYIRFGTSAAGIDNGTSIELVPGASITYDNTAIPTQAIQVNAATTGHKFIALEG